jgi:hypothetical protein
MPHKSITRIEDDGKLCGMDLGLIGSTPGMATKEQPRLSCFHLGYHEISSRLVYPSQPSRLSSDVQCILGKLVSA